MNATTHNEEARRDAPASGTQAVNRALAVLACFRDGSPDLGVSDIARRLALKASTVHRLPRTLLEAGFIEQDATTSRYRLGNALAEYGQIVYRQRRVDVAEPYLRRLARATGDNVALAVRHGADVLLLANSEPRTAGGPEVTGRRIPLHATALGKVLLAWAPEDEADLRTIGPLTRATERTITDPAELSVELDRTRGLGYAISDEELSPGIRTVAVPVLDHAGHAVFALAVRGPVGRITDPRIPEIIERTRTTADQIAAALLR